MVSKRDQEILQKLATDVRKISELPIMDEKRRMWQKFNDLKPERPMVLCYPEGSWEELLPYSNLICEDEFLRYLEWKLRSQIYWWENIRDDNTIEPYFDMSWNITNDGFGVDIQFENSGERGSYRWEPPIKDLGKDLNKLHKRNFSVNRKQTFENIEITNSIFGQILPARIRGNPSCYGFTWKAIDLLGLENFMFLMYDDPENLHKLMTFLRDDFIDMMKWHEREGLLTLQNENDYVGSGGVAYTTSLPKQDWKLGDPVRLIDIWGVAESQETVGVSPDMFKEFVLPYQRPMLELTGLNHYGCCEGLHERIKDILTLPNLRRISVSPWCDQEIMAENLKNDYIFSRKPNPSDICVGFDEAYIRKDIRNTLSIASGCVLEFIMKDTHTIQNQPWRIGKWVEIVREEICNF